MYVIERGLNCRWGGCVFAGFTVLAGFGIGNMSQANAVVSQVHSAFPSLDPVFSAQVLGAAMAILTALVIIGGVKSIARASSFLVPVMAIAYVIGCVAILILNADRVPAALSLIVTSAFSGQAAVGGFAGAGVAAAMRFGIARGLFSNESGLGSAPIVAAAARTTHPMRQALVSATGTFWDTVVICALTGLVLVSSGHWSEGLKNTELTQAAFADLATYGPIFLFFGLITFVFSTIIGWSYYGEKAAEYLWGHRAILPYRIVWVLAVYVGATIELKTVWNFSDAANGLMAIPNLFSLILLSHVISSETKNGIDSTEV
jgi:AGCS family alanine or glycine:cation symporter